MKKFFTSKLGWIIILAILALLVIISFFYITYLSIFKDFGKEDSPAISDIVEREVGQYKLYKDSSSYQVELFDTFETLYDTTLNTVEADTSNTELMTYLDNYAKNFLADYITLSAKEPEYKRIGGMQFIASKLQSEFINLDSVRDYYTAYEYYVLENEKTYQEDLPEVTSIDGDDFGTSLFKYKDISTQDEVETTAIYFNYTITYANQNLSDFTYLSDVYVYLINLDGIWTVIEFGDNLDDGYRPTINF